ncbi:diguanylate cyclase [bacterium]|nr:diguanylate cyclase [bacterium]
MKLDQISQDFPILVVEDNPESRLLLEKTFDRVGNNFLSVTNGREAIAAFEERFYPIVVTDWMMPEMDGIELCQTLRKRIANGYVYILVLTARDSTKEIVTGLEAGADDYLTKPFSAAELLARLKTAQRILELEKTLKQANEEIRILSITDPLTGTYNRGYLAERLPEEIQRANRYNHPLSIILCDIDRFKSINDNYGHEAGNRTICAFIDCIRKTVRQDVDWVARYGGEEFLVVVPETNTQGALRLAERIRENISQKTIRFEKQEIRITASFGVVGLDTADNALRIRTEDLVKRADKHLYDCKMNGRNCVTGSSL